MRKLSLSLLTLSLGVALLPLAQAATTPAQEHLLEQVRLGEASNREDLVRQSLYRLELIDPNNPELIAARMRYLLRQGDAAGAQKETAAIFDLYSHLLSDARLRRELFAEVDKGAVAEWAVKKIIEKFAEQFAALSDGYLKERAGDLRTLDRKSVV